MRSTPSSPPWATTSCAPPGMTSSAGWKISRTAMPRSRQASSWAASARPAPSSAAMWTSCPQAWQMPSWTEAHGRPLRSSTGSASRSARRATRYAASCGPRSATRPVPGSGRTRMPAASSRRATSVVVRVSARASSGCACRSRRTSTSSGASPSTVAARASVRERRSTRPADYRAARQFQAGARLGGQVRSVAAAALELVDDGLDVLRAGPGRHQQRVRGVDHDDVVQPDARPPCARPGHDQAPGVDRRRRGRAAPRILSPGTSSAVGDQRRRARRSRPRRPSRSRRARRRPGRRRRPARRRRGRSRSSSAPATARPAGPGRPRAPAGRRARSGWYVASRSSSTDGPDDEHAGVPAVLARRPGTRAAVAASGFSTNSLTASARGAPSTCSGVARRGCSRTRSRGGSARCRS